MKAKRIDVTQSGPKEKSVPGPKVSPSLDGKSFSSPKRMDASGEPITERKGNPPNNSTIEKSPKFHGKKQSGC